MVPKKPLRLFSVFWGDKHLDLFEKALVRSLSWPLNKAALEGATWDIWTKMEDFSAAADIAKKVGIHISLNEADPFLNDLETKYLNDQGVMINQMFLNSMRRCLDSKAQMLIAPPDTIFGGDSVANILQAGEQPGVVVFVVHMRVLPKILDLINGPYHAESIGNSRLCLLAMKAPHRSWIEAEYGHERSNTYVGGIMWKKRPNGVFAISHMLPTPYLINWTEEDFKFFSRPTKAGEWPPVFGEIDHLWPAHLVHPQSRARILGSSDDAFIVEITDEESNVPPLMNYSKDEPDRFWRNASHNLINKQFLVTFKGE